MKKLVALLAMVAVCAASVFANGQGEGAAAPSASQVDWPKRPINIVVAFGAGGNSDYNTRAIAKYLAKDLGQPIAVTGCVSFRTITAIIPISPIRENR